SPQSSPGYAVRRHALVRLDAEVRAHTLEGWIVQIDLASWLDLDHAYRRPLEDRPALEVPGPRHVSDARIARRSIGRGFVERPSRNAQCQSSVRAAHGGHIQVAVVHSGIERR